MNVQDELAHYGLTAERVLDLAGAIAAKNYRRVCVDPIEDPAATRALFEPFLAGRSEECFAAAFLDARHRLIELEILFFGTIDGATVYPRVVAARALRYGAAAVIFAHNHPSGSGEPSLADQAITRRLSDGLALFDIRVLDHFIVGAGEPVSMASRGLIGGHLGPVPRFSEEEIAAKKAMRAAMRARQSAAMKKSWATRKAKAAAKLQAAQEASS